MHPSTNNEYLPDVFLGFWGWNSSPLTCKDATQYPHPSHFLTCCGRTWCRGSTNHFLYAQNDIRLLAWADYTSIKPAQAQMELNCRTLIKPPSQRTMIKQSQIISIPYTWVILIVVSCLKSYGLSLDGQAVRPRSHHPHFQLLLTFPGDFDIFGFLQGIKNSSWKMIKKII